MKKLLMVLCAVMMVFGMVETASALTFIDEQYFDRALALEGTEVSISGRYEYTHSTVEDFLGISDPLGHFSIKDVFLEIEGSYDVYVADEDGFEVEKHEFEVEIVGRFYGGTMIWYNTKIEDILNVDVNWDYAGDLVAGVNFQKAIILHSSIFTVDYEPVPEPSTILLLGSGLLGLVGYNRKRFSKKS
ncbi:MAG: PEP-CTERM sorting domain-containing protein [Thermodesulfobacteriota bacterium]|nr:PEP-CTERM sorting domain-containing protein [Thermodesulfobacteriota bacterium]